MLLDNVSVNVAQSTISVKFNNHVKVATLVTENFSLYLDSATPTLISDAFNEIDCNDYNSISRVLTLSLDSSLEANTAYVLRVENVEYAGSGTPVEDDYSFVTTDAVTGIVEAVPEPVFIDDFSIKSTIDIYDGDMVTGSSEFYFIDSDPVNSDFYVESDYNDGRITITFNANPDVSYLNADYIKVQRKKNQIGPTRWEAVPVNFAMSSTKPVVYLSFPAIEDAAIYREPGYTYFEEGYVYRVRLSRYIQAA